MASPLHVFARGDGNDVEQLPVVRVRVGAAVSMLMYPFDSFGITYQAAVDASRALDSLVYRASPPNKSAWLCLFAREQILYDAKGRPKFRTWVKEGMQVSRILESIGSKGYGPIPLLQRKWPDATEGQYIPICDDLMEYFEYHAQELLGITRGRKIRGTNLIKILKQIETTVSLEKLTL